MVMLDLENGGDAGSRYLAMDITFVFGILYHF